MAFIHTEKCGKCGKLFEAVDKDYTCPDCHIEIAVQLYKDYMHNIRQSKTLEQRIEQIEEWIYQNKDNIHTHNGWY